jgi:hypothetical protein
MTQGDSAKRSIAVAVCLANGLSALLGPQAAGVWLGLGKLVSKTNKGRTELHAWLVRGSIKNATLDYYRYRFNSYSTRAYPVHAAMHATHARY